MLGWRSVIGSVFAQRTEEARFAGALEFVHLIDTLAIVHAGRRFAFVYVRRTVFGREAGRTNALESVHQI